ncbi:MAG: glycosyltransferase family 2 protein [bacterium]
MPYLSIIIPFYNEERNLPFLVEELVSVLASINKSFEVIFIDDGSTDNGFDILRQLVVNKDTFGIIRFRRRFGQTAAWAAGLDQAKGDIIVIMDADLENDTNDIPKLLVQIDNGYDIVSGWRKDRWSDKLFTRRLTSKTANWLVSKISGVELHDLGCSLRAYRREVLEGVNLYGEMHRFLAILAYWQGAKMIEVEVNFRPRKFGQSKYGLGRIKKVLLDLIVIKFLSGYSTKPIYFFGKIGLVSMFFGFITFLLATYYKITGQKDYVETPLPILIVLFIVLAVLLVLIGLLAEMIMRTYHESQDKKIYSIKEKINF